MTAQPETPETQVVVTWTERHECEHHFTLAEARAFVDRHGLATLPEDATAEQVAAALADMDLTNALAEIEPGDITFVAVYRDIESVKASASHQVTAKDFGLASHFALRPPATEGS